MKTLNAYYDLEIGPVSFDFVVFAVKAEIYRRKINADKLHIVIVPFVAGVLGMFRDKTALYDGAEMTWRLWNIVIPACQLIGATFTLAHSWDHACGIKCSSEWPNDWDCQSLRNRRHLIGDVITDSKAGVEIPVLHASEHARRTVRKLNAGKRVVTMTKRHTYMGARNTDDNEWECARMAIEGAGYTVRVIDDVSVALAHGRGFAELSLDLRMAMYEQAECNIMANNGAASLCWFSRAPYLMLDAGVGDTREEWRGLFEDQGLPWGDTWPWATDKQRIIYERSTCEVIMREFDRGLG